MCIRIGHVTRNYRWLSILSLSLVLVLQACIGDSNSSFNSHQTQGSGSIGVNNTQFNGNILFAKSGNIFSWHTVKRLDIDGSALCCLCRARN